MTPISGETNEGRKRRLAASQRGADATRAAFGEALTRKNYAAAVGIHPKTLLRWEKAGAVKPKLQKVAGISTWIFTDRDVEVGRRLITLLREEPGVYSLPEAARRARRRS